MFKTNRIKLLISLIFVPSFAYALPQGASVANGTVNISKSGTTMTINSSPNAIVNWNSFDIGKNEAVKINQKNANSAVLNRVMSGSPTNILGQLQSNGRVFLINPSGIVFGGSSVVNVAGLVASTLDISDNDFKNGILKFENKEISAGKISNSGLLKAANGGYVYLFSEGINNDGIITAPGGDVILATGHKIEIGNTSTPGLHVVVTADLNNVNITELIKNNNYLAINNSGTISANSVVKSKNGTINIRSAGDINLSSSSVVESNGDKIGKSGGSVLLVADNNGYFDGTISATGINGGYVETSGHKRLEIKSSPQVFSLNKNGNPGTWLIDPENIVVTTFSTVTGQSGPIFTPMPGVSYSYIDYRLINTAMVSGANVILDTSGSTDGNGSIYVQTSLTAGAGYYGTLSLKSAGPQSMVQISSAVSLGSGNFEILAAGSSNINNAVSANKIKIVAQGDLAFNTGSLLNASSNLSDAIVVSANRVLDGNIQKTLVTPGNWKIYASDVNTSQYSGFLVSDYSPIWNKNIQTLSPSDVGLVGNRYIFAQSPNVVVDVAPISKVYGANITPVNWVLGVDYNVTGLFDASNPIYKGSFKQDYAMQISDFSFASPGFDVLADVGQYAIVSSNNSLSRYGYGISTSVSSQVQVTPAPLYVTANNGTKIYGDADGVLGYGVAGFVNNQTSSIITGGLSRVTGENVGLYGIDLGSLSAGNNYQINYTSGVYTINPADLLITADNKIANVGDIMPTLTASYSGFKLNDTAGVVSGLSLSTTALDTSISGIYSINATGATASNYNITYSPGTLTLNSQVVTPPPPPPPVTGGGDDGEHAGGNGHDSGDTHTDHTSHNHSDNEHGNDSSKQHENNGWGNGDQSAPGGSARHNNAENSEKSKK